MVCWWPRTSPSGRGGGPRLQGGDDFAAHLFGLNILKIREELATNPRSATEPVTEDGMPPLVFAVRLASALRDPTNLFHCYYAVHLLISSGADPADRGEWSRSAWEEIKRDAYDGRLESFVRLQYSLVSPPESGQPRPRRSQVRT